MFTTRAVSPLVASCPPRRSVKPRPVGPAAHRLPTSAACHDPRSHPRASSPQQLLIAQAPAGRRDSRAAPVDEPGGRFPLGHQGIARSPTFARYRLSLGIRTVGRKTDRRVAPRRDSPSPAIREDDGFEKSLVPSTAAARRVLRPVSSLVRPAFEPSSSPFGDAFST